MPPIPCHWIESKSTKTASFRPPQWSVPLSAATANLPIFPCPIVGHHSRRGLRFELIRLIDQIKSMIRLTDLSDQINDSIDMIESLIRLMWSNQINDSICSVAFASPSTTARQTTPTNCRSSETTESSSRRSSRITNPKSGWYGILIPNFVN